MDNLKPFKTIEVCVPIDTDGKISLLKMRTTIVCFAIQSNALLRIQHTADVNAIFYDKAPVALKPSSEMEDDFIIYHAEFPKVLFGRQVDNIQQHDPISVVNADAVESPGQVSFVFECINSNDIYVLSVFNVGRMKRDSVGQLLWNRSRSRLRAFWT